MFYVIMLIFCSSAFAIDVYKLIRGNFDWTDGFLMTCHVAGFIGAFVWFRLFYSENKA